MQGLSNLKPRVQSAQPSVAQAQPLPETYGRGRGGRPWRRKRAEVLKRDGYRCQCEDCKRLKRMRLATEVDHIVPRCQGGTDEDSNLRAMHTDCHALKSRREAGGRGGPHGGSGASRT